jgi:CheY-like chemotaxis protein
MTPKSKGTILVVDDDRLVLATLAHGLSQAGYDVIDADNGDDAILLAREHRPHLALLDIRMQGMSGFDVAAYLRANGHVPFMFLSAFADAQTVAPSTTWSSRSTSGRSCRPWRRRSPTSNCTTPPRPPRRNARASRSCRSPRC